MLYMIFQYGSEPVLIQQILIGFEAILENLFVCLARSLGQLQGRENDFVL